MRAAPESKAPGFTCQTLLMRGISNTTPTKQPAHGALQARPQHHCCWSPTFVRRALRKSWWPPHRCGSQYHHRMVTLPMVRLAMPLHPSNAVGPAVTRFERCNCLLCRSWSSLLGIAWGCSWLWQDGPSCPRRRLPRHLRCHLTMCFPPQRRLLSPSSRSRRTIPCQP